MDKPEKFIHKPTESWAIQFTGFNVDAVTEFAGSRHIHEDDEYTAPCFNPIGTYLVPHLHPGAIAELWVEANQSHLPIELDEWIVKDDIGCYPCKNDIFQINQQKAE